MLKTHLFGGFSSFLQVLDCSFCRTQSDYLLFTLSKLFLVLSVSVVVLGLATSTSQTGRFRTHLVVCVVLWGCFEAWVITMEADLFPELWPHLLTAQKMQILRSLLLSVLAFVPHLFPDNFAWTNKEMLIHLGAETNRFLKMSEHALKRQQEQGAPAAAH